MERHDEYFTSLKEIEKEMRYYKPHFKNKIVFANANDNTESAFFKFFKKNFKPLNLKLLYCLSLEGVLYTYNGEDLDVKKLQNGDFRQEESVNILKNSDIIVSNPPFSLIKDYFDILIKYKKKFLIIANHISVSYSNIFPHIKERKVWQGVSIPKTFYNLEGKKQAHVAGLCRWFTNLEHKQIITDIPLREEYSDKKHPKYDNFEAIDCKEVKNIPDHYRGIIGVPVSFIDKWNPYQFSILEIKRGLKIEGEIQPMRLLICRYDKYSPLLSIKELAERNNLSQSAIRKYIRVNKIPRREDRKEVIHNKINSLFLQNPNLSIRQIARKLCLSPTTVSKYLHKE